MSLFGWLFKKKKKETKTTEAKVAKAVEKTNAPVNYNSSPTDDVAPGDKGNGFDEPQPVEETKETPIVEPAATKEVSQDSPEDLSELTVKELKELAKERGLSGYSTLKKAELIDLLK